jgi:hypothetical protein
MRNFAIVELILRERGFFFAAVRDCDELWAKNLAMIISSATFLAIYGAVMGASHGLDQAASSLIKLPLLFLVTLLICAPSLYFFNLLFGSKQRLPQIIALILTAITVTAVLLLGLAPITFFFLITTSQYQFFKLLNVVFFAIASILGVIFLQQGMKTISDPAKEQGARARRVFLLIWIVLYGFVGTQMAWTLSPFMGDPHLPFIVLQQMGGNFYADVLNSLRQLLSF